MTAESSAPSPPSRPLRVLVLDDSADDATLVLRDLRKAGWAVEHCLTDDPENFRALLKEREWDIILSDYWMPRFDGLRAVGILRETGLDIPLIIISGAIGEESAAAVLKAGAADFISKGNMSRLTPAIERELREATARRELREAERRLIASEARFRILLDGIQDYAIFMLDNDARITSWNRGAQRIFGHTTKEALGLPMAAFFTPEDCRKGLPELEISAARNSGKFEGEGWRVRRDGAFIWVHVVVSALHDDSGQVFGFTVVVRDITKQKLVEEALQRSTQQIQELSGHLQAVREEERTEIAREIHDELGQLLTIIKFDLSHLARNPPTEAELLGAKLRETAESVDSAIQTVRRIITELRPGILDDMGLVAAMEWHAQEFQARTGIKCDVILPSGQVVLDRQRSTAVFRIFQEILTNVAKHARATGVDVILSTDPRSLLLEVKDNGLGFNEENLTKANSFGLAGMRERLRKYGGRLEISGVPSKGTTVTVEMPFH